MILVNRHRNGFRLLPHITIAVALLFFPKILLAAELLVGDLISENDRRFIELRVTGYQEADILEAIKRGIEAKITFTLQIVKEGPMDFVYTKAVRTTHINRSVKFDFWSRSFVLSERGIKATFHNERAMLNAFFTVGKCEIPPGGLQSGQRYRIRARAELTSVELYFPMNLIFKYIVGYWDFDTGWIGGPSFVAQP